MPRQTLKKRPDGRFVCTYHGKFFYGYTQAGEDAIKEYRQSLIRFWIPTVISFFAMLFAGIACFTR